MTALPQSAPVIIVGGGICGASTLYHLAKRGIPALLVERKKLASGNDLARGRHRRTVA